MHKKSSPEIGQKFGRWTVCSEDQRKQGLVRSFYWKVRCECGEERFVNSSRLRTGRATTCEKCHIKDIEGSKYIPVVGQKFGSYEVISSEIQRQGVSKAAYFQVKCLLCNNIFTRYAKHLVEGKRKCCKQCGHKQQQIGDYPPTGTEFGDYKVIDGDKYKLSFIGGHHLIHVQCSCGSTNYVSRYNLERGLSTHCRACTSKFCKKNYKDIGGSYLASVRAGANDRSLKFEVSGEYLWNVFLSQNSKCAISGVQIKLDPSWGAKRKLEKQIQQTASLDRIDSSKGYIEGNVQWLHKDVNMMKRHHDEKYFIELCKLIAANN